MRRPCKLTHLLAFSLIFLSSAPAQDTKPESQSEWQRLKEQAEQLGRSAGRTISDAVKKAEEAAGLSTPTQEAEGQSIGQEATTELEQLPEQAIEADRALREDTVRGAEELKSAAESVESESPSHTLKKLAGESQGLLGDAEAEIDSVRKKVNAYGERLQGDLTRLAGKDISDFGARLHYELAVISRFPSASQCADCHPKHYREWAASPHAYAQISPVFNAMQGTFIKRSAGTNGDFCIRCHSQVGMALEEPLFTANSKRSAVAREGITCIVCHRIDKAYGRVSGRFALAEGPIYDPMYGPFNDEILEQVLDEFNVSPAPDVKPGGAAIHNSADKRLYFSTAQLCSMCHDVNSQNGFRLEAAYTQFLNSPARARGEVCQDCHMGKTPGIKSGYDRGPVASIGGTPTPDKKLTSHQFPGPDYPIVHPGIFPQSTEGPRIASFEDWLRFDYRAGWGADFFESVRKDGQAFPEGWKSHDKRREGRVFIEAQLRRIAEFDVPRHQLLRRAYQFKQLVVEQNSDEGISFKVQIRNGTDGHNAPTGFDSERLVFVQVTVTDSEGKAIFRSGDRDPNGDVRSILSRYVHNWEVPADPYLLTIESDFQGLLIRGGLRPEILTVDFSDSSLPFVRPNPASSLLKGTSPATKKFVKSLPPNGTLWGNYSVDSTALTGKTPYKVNLKFISQMVPAHLIWDISGVGFDYGLSAREVGDRVVKGALVLWEHNILLDAKNGALDLTPTEDQILHSPPQQARDSWRLDLDQLF